MIDRMIRLTTIALLALGVGLQLHIENRQWQLNKTQAIILSAQHDIGTRQSALNERLKQIMEWRNGR